MPSSLSNLQQPQQQKDPQHIPSVIIRTRPSRKARKQTMTPPPPQPNTPLNVDMQIFHSQSFKPHSQQDADQEVFDNDVISALQFNAEGDLLAVGDRGGRIQVYKRENQYRSYSPYISFQSHVPDFDYLKSIEIEEKITQIKWLKAVGRANHLLSTNDRTIKLWRVGETMKVEYSSQTIPTSSRLVIPRPTSAVLATSSYLRKSYNNGHTFHINTLSVNSDGQTFASSDDLRINVWDTDRTDTSFVIVDMKPENMENLTEVITTCSFHPTSCNILSYSTSRGSTKLCDMRVSATCDNALRHYREDNGCKGFFVEVVNSVSDAQFSNCGTCLATRDFMYIKIWDTRMESSSLLTIPVHDFLKPHLTTLYENDMIFDKFTVSWNHDDSYVVTGSYNDLFCIAEPDKTAYKSSLFQFSENYKDSSYMLKPMRIIDSGGKSDNPSEEVKIDEVELSKRTLLSQWHPKENVVAVASSNQLSVFNEKKRPFL